MRQPASDALDIFGWDTSDWVKRKLPDPWKPISRQNNCISVQLPPSTVVGQVSALMIG